MTTHAERLARIETRIDEGLKHLEQEAEEQRKWRESMDSRLRTVESTSAKHGSVYGIIASIFTTALVAAFTSGPKVGG